jgi:hypothetical protein
MSFLNRVIRGRGVWCFFLILFFFERAQLSRSFQMLVWKSDPFGHISLPDVHVEVGRNMHRTQIY